MAKILSVHIEGFVSVIEKIKYKFDRPGLNLITGKNGAGKTTIFNALAYGLYGQTLKPKSSILPWPSIIDDAYRGCRITVKLDNGVSVIRCNEFKGKVFGRAGKDRLIISINDTEQLQFRGKVETQAYINTLIGYSFQLFKSSVLFAQELTSLIEDDGPTKKKTFDEAFASAFINKAKENAEAKLKTITNEHTGIQSRLSAKDTVLENNRNLLEQVYEANKKFALQKGAKISKLRREVKVLEKEKDILISHNPIIELKPKIKQTLQSLRDKSVKITNTLNYHIDKEEFQLMLDITRYTSELEKIEDKKTKVKKNLKPICLTCGQKLKGEKLEKYRQSIRHQFGELKKEGKEIDLALKLTTKRHKAAQEGIEEQKVSRLELRSIEEQIAAVENELERADKAHSKVKVKKAQIKQLKKEISRVRKEEHKTDTTKIEGDIVELEKEVKDLKKQSKNLQGKIDIQTWLIKDPLSNSGLKAFIFDSMLKRVNYFLKYYTKFIGFRVQIGMDLESANKDFVLSIFKKSDEVPYYDLSKGQKQLAKVVLCFAINKTLQASKPLNILLMDELFEALSPENVEVIGHIITDEARNRSVHVITHHTSFNPNNSHKTFIALNSKDQTVIEQKYKEA